MTGGEHPPPRGEGPAGCRSRRPAEMLLPQPPCDATVSWNSTYPGLSLATASAALPRGPWRSVVRGQASVAEHCGQA